MKTLYLSSIFVFIFWNVNAQSDSVSHGLYNLSIELLYCDTPIVQGTLNGIKAHFLLDTGSSITLLNLSDKKKYGFKLHKKLQKKMVGFSGNTSSLWGLYAAELRLSGKVIAAPFVGNHLNQLKQEIKQRTGIEIVGIIGYNTMKAYGFVMDFAQRRCLIGVGKDGKFFANAKTEFMQEKK